jgi:hypothetical protein
MRLGGLSESSQGVVTREVRARRGTPYDGPAPRMGACHDCDRMWGLLFHGSDVACESNTRQLWFGVSWGETM